MTNLNIKNEHKVLISSVIKENPKFQGNEHLLNEFLEAMYKKSAILLDAIKDLSRLKRHLIMMSDSCMAQVIKNNQEKQETKLYKQVEQNVRKRQSIVSLKKNVRQVPYDNSTTQEKIVNLREEIERKERYSNVDTILDPLDFYEKKEVSENTLDKLLYLVKEIDLELPDKCYYKIFTLRYLKKYSQSEIAQELRISQTELSKRFVELIKLTRESL